MKNQKLNLLFIGALVGLMMFFPDWAAAQRRQVTQSSSTKPLTYDLSASVGTYNTYNYTEINLGLNWPLENWLIWRNALFSRFGSNIDSVTGLDTSMRLSQNFRTDSGSFGIDLFAGPGLRLANQNSTAIFAEAGIAFKLAGLYLGGGVKSLYYTADRKDSSGIALPHNDSLFFIILSGGGAF